MEKDNTAASPLSGAEREKSKEEKAGEGNKRAATTTAAAVVEQAAIITSTSRAHIGSAHITAGAGSHLTFNPFLIPGMSHGLLYPHMFLPHGGIMALPAMPPGAVEGSPGSPKRRRKKEDKDEEKLEEEKELKAGVRSQTICSSSPSTSAKDPSETVETEEKGANKTPEPDSQDRPEETSTKQDGMEEAEEQRQADREEG